MSVLSFEREEALLFAITSGLVPEDVLATGARTWRQGDAIVVAPRAALSAEASKRLAEAGVRREKATLEPPAGAAPRDVRCWAEIVAPRRVRDLDADVGQVLFVVPSEASLCELAGELLRLGCDRFDWRSADDGHVLRAASPPYYSLVRAMDRPAGIRAFAPAPPGQDRVFVELGHAHPLARWLRPDPGGALLVGKDGAFATLPDAPFADAYALVDLRVPGDERPRDLASAAHAPRLSVTLRLARAATALAPTIWVLRDDAVARTEKLLASLPEEIARGLLFAACDGEDGAPIVVVRARPGARATVEIEGEAYRAHPAVPNLFLPCDATLEPPLRRDRVAALLAPEPDAIAWLRPLDGGRFRVERLREDAFQPLAEWVEYVVDTNAATLQAWVRSCTFDFDAFVGAEPSFDRGPRRDAPDDDDRPKKARRERAVEVPAPAPPRTTRAARVAAPARTAPLAAAEIEVAPAAEALAELEKEFLALDAPADDPARRALWARMAPLAARLARHQDATLSWARAVWDVPADDAAESAAPWAAAAAAAVHLARDAAPIRTLLALEEPSADHVRALAAVIVAEADAARAELAHDASLWLDRHDASLDVRTSWLARVALARLVGGDRLGLARARDRLLARIHRGLSVERDVPSFLRRSGAGRDAAQVELLAGKLEALHAKFGATKRKRSATEADPRLTGAYVGFVVAYGAARLGRVEWARSLLASSVAGLDANDPIHGFLSAAYAARVGHALEGLPAETPLPAELSARLNALAKLDRYKVDRVRQCSKVLEPQERLDPIAAFHRGEADPRGPEFADLRGVADEAILAKGIAAIMTKAKASAPEERARLYDGAMDFFPLVSHETATGHLETVLGSVADVPPPRRAQLLEEALMLAGHLGEERLARTIFGVLEPLVAGVSPDDAATIAPLVGGMLRTLRRVGLADEASRLLVAIQGAARGKGTPHLVARLHAAAGLAHLGDLERARPVFDEALGALAGELPMPERLVLTRATARSLAATPIAYAVAGLEALEKKLAVVTDSFNTNTHVCLSVVDFMEALVLGYASDDLAIGPAARRWLDDDEYLVRRRIHRDLSR